MHKRLVSDDWEFLSTPSARRATLPAGEQAAAMGISIHALREEGDLRISDALELKTAFLSTPSARRATKNPSFDVAVRINFYPRPPRGGRPGAVQGFVQDIEISIHALREEGDGCRFKSCKRHFIFLSTPSARRATPPHPAGRLERHISIHALREEGDPDPSGTNRKAPNFYPRPPRGGRLFDAIVNEIVKKFLSTPSARRATGRTDPKKHRQRHFYPRPPRGGRRCALCASGGALSFLSTPSARRATAGLDYDPIIDIENFYPRPPRGGRRADRVFLPKGSSFLSTPSARRATSII